MQFAVGFVLAWMIAEQRLWTQRLLAQAERQG
jgi:hypothetical protein